MANSDSDCPWSSAQSQKSKHCRKKRKAKLIAIMDDNNDLKPKHGKNPASEPEPGAPKAKITRPCSECGKKFWSWKALFGHMRCHPERQWRGINPPPNFRRQNDKQVVWMTEEDHEVAQCLLLLANGTHDQESETCVPVEGPGPSGLNTRFECSGCKRVFGSGQALGGHRASHKIHSDGDGDDGRDGDHESKMGMVLLGGHKCSICQRVFSSGQALGGHKRCHWEKGDNVNDPAASSSITITTQRKQACGCGTGVDLNLPPPLPLPLPLPLQHHSPLTLDLRLGLYPPT